MGADSFGNWKETAHLAFLYGQSAGFSTAQRLEGTWQTDYNFSKKTFVFGSIAGEDDRFDGFAYQVTLSTGLGQKLIESDTTKLTVTAGFGYRRLQIETLNKDPDGRVVSRDKGPSASDGVGTVGLDYSQQLTKTTKLVDRLAIQSGGQNTAVANDFSVSVSMTDSPGAQCRLRGALQQRSGPGDEADRPTHHGQSRLRLQPAEEVTGRVCGLGVPRGGNARHAPCCDSWSPVAGRRVAVDRHWYKVGTSAIVRPISSLDDSRHAIAKPVRSPLAEP